MPNKPSVFLSLTPMIPTSGGLSGALKFYKDELGVSVLWQSDTGAGSGREFHMIPPSGVCFQFYARNE